MNIFIAYMILKNKPPTLVCGRLFIYRLQCNQAFSKKSFMDFLPFNICGRMILNPVSPSIVHYAGDFIGRVDKITAISNSFIVVILLKALLCSFRRNGKCLPNLHSYLNFTGKFNFFTLRKNFHVMFTGLEHYPCRQESPHQRALRSHKYRLAPSLGLPFLFARLPRQQISLSSGADILFEFTDTL